MQSTPRKLPRMPEIGYPESHYARKIRQADLESDHHAHEAYKVAQYITLAMSPRLPWSDKLRYFRHALRRHCNTPPLPTDEVWIFYKDLADLVRRHAGQEALRLALAEDDLYTTRIAMGTPRERIEEEAEQFFGKLLPHQDHCPEHFNDEDWSQLKMIRNQWI